MKSASSDAGRLFVYSYIMCIEPKEAEDEVLL